MGFECITPYQLVAIVIAISLILDESLEPDELALTGAFITGISGIIFLIAAHKIFLKARQEKAKNKDDIQCQIKKLQEQCKKFDCR